MLQALLHRIIAGLAACLVFTATTATDSLSQTLNQLYGLTANGQLFRINTATGTGGRIRAPLPSSYTAFQALAYRNGWFYAAYGAGRIMKFGFRDGEEVDLGASGLAIVKGLAFNSTGTLYAAGSTDGDGNPETIATINLTTGAATTVVSIDRETYLLTTDNIVGIAFKSDGSLYAITRQPNDSYGHGFVIDLATGLTHPGPVTQAPSCAGNWYGNNKSYEDIAIVPGTNNAYSVDNSAYEALWTLQIPPLGYCHGLVSTIAERRMHRDDNTDMRGLTFGPKLPPRAMEAIHKLILD